jgi:hypothetical protein
MSQSDINVFLGLVREKDAAALGPSFAAINRLNAAASANVLLNPQPCVNPRIDQQKGELLSEPLLAGRGCIGQTVCGLAAGKAEIVTPTNISSSAARIRDLQWTITRAQASKSVATRLEVTSSAQRFQSASGAGVLRGRFHCGDSPRVLCPTRRLQDCSRITGRNSCL